MTLALISRVGPEQASMTDTLKFGPSVCLTAGISDNPNISTHKYISLYHLTEGDVNCEKACWLLLFSLQMASNGSVKAADL